jgi:hypothetical protein
MSGLFDDILAMFGGGAAPEKPKLLDVPQESYPPRWGVDITGRGVTSAPLALLQLLDGHGLSPAQMDRNAAMHGPLYSSALREHPWILDAKMAPGYVAPPRPVYNQTDRRMLAEDLNSVKIKFDNWQKQNLGQELTPQERVTQSFIDVRNPNSWF